MTPAIVLVRPQMGENIGAVARAMSNFGLRDLRIVSPRDGWPNEKAQKMAAGGLDIINSAKLYNTVPQALEGIIRAYATTARADRDLPKRIITVEEMATEICHSQDRAMCSEMTAILFGAERSGLENEELILAEALVTIPVSAENPSLNIGQAAVVLCYELYKHMSFPPNEAQAGTQEKHKIPGQGEDDEIGPATLPELEGFLLHAKELLDRTNHFRDISKAEGMWLNLRSRIVGMRLTTQDVQVLRGLIRTMLRHLK